MTLGASHSSKAVQKCKRTAVYQSKIPESAQLKVGLDHLAFQLEATIRDR